MTESINMSTLLYKRSFEKSCSAGYVQLYIKLKGTQPTDSELFWPVLFNWRKSEKEFTTETEKNQRNKNKHLFKGATMARDGEDKHKLAEIFRLNFSIKRRNPRRGLLNL